MKNKIECQIFLPSLEGFYESCWTPDWEQIEADHDERGITLTDEWGIDEQYYKDVAAEYTACMQECYRNELGVDIRLEFTELVSPREYNFSTDKIYCKLSCDNIKDFVGRINALILENYDKMSEYIKERHSTRDGFVSFLSSEIREWLHEWQNDERMMSCVLFYLVDIFRNKRGELESIDSELYYQIHEQVDSTFYARPNSDKAKEELKAIELREAQEEAMRKYQLKLPLEF